MSVQWLARPGIHEDGLDGAAKTAWNSAMRERPQCGWLTLARLAINACAVHKVHTMRLGKTRLAKSPWP